MHSLLYFIFVAWKLQGDNSSDESIIVYWLKELKSQIQGRKETQLCQNSGEQIFRFLNLGMV